LPIERELGGVDAFLPYIRDYVATFLGKSITTEDWKKHLFSYYAEKDTEKLKILNGIDWEVDFFVCRPLLPFSKF
jgi:leukotriene-A4 hydrolase